MMVRKRTLVGLISLGWAVLVALSAAVIWWLSASPAAVLRLGTFLAMALVLGSLLALLSLLAGLLVAKPPSWLVWVARQALGGLYPLAERVGRFLGWDQDTVRASFIAVHNQLIRSLNVRVPPADILVLLPVCLQHHQCQYKITVDIQGCRRCGRCPVSQVLSLKARYGFRCAVVTGGTMARKLVKELQPKAVVAVACERDLVSGINDTRGFPVLGVANIRPNGPCFDTRADLDLVEEAVRQFLQPGQVRLGEGIINRNNAG